jgi:hypothetical protein
LKHLPLFPSYLSLSLSSLLSFAMSTAGASRELRALLGDAPAVRTKKAKKTPPPDTGLSAEVIALRENSERRIQKMYHDAQQGGRLPPSLPSVAEAIPSGTALPAINPPSQAEVIPTTIEDTEMIPYWDRPGSNEKWALLRAAYSTVPLPLIMSVLNAAGVVPASTSLPPSNLSSSSEARYGGASPMWTKAERVSMLRAAYARGVPVPLGMSALDSGVDPITFAVADKVQSLPANCASDTSETAKTNTTTTSTTALSSSSSLRTEAPVMVREGESKQSEEGSDDMDENDDDDDDDNDGENCCEDSDDDDIDTDETDDDETDDDEEDEEDKDVLEATIRSLQSAAAEVEGQTTPVVTASSSSSPSNLIPAAKRARKSGYVRKPPRIDPVTGKSLRAYNKKVGVLHGRPPKGVLASPLRNCSASRCQPPASSTTAELVDEKGNATPVNALKGAGAIVQSKRGPGRPRKDGLPPIRKHKPVVSVTSSSASSASSLSVPVNAAPSAGTRESYYQSSGVNMSLPSNQSVAVSKAKEKGVEKGMEREITQEWKPTLKQLMILQDYCAKHGGLHGKKRAHREEVVISDSEDMDVVKGGKEAGGMLVRHVSGGVGNGTVAKVVIQTRTIYYE